MKIIQLEEKDRIEIENARAASERDWITNIPALDSRDKRHRMEIAQLAPLIEQAHLAVNENMRMRDQQLADYREADQVLVASQTSVQALKKFEKRAAMMQQLLLNIFKALYSFRGKIQAKFDVFERLI